MPRLPFTPSSLALPVLALMLLASCGGGGGSSSGGGTSAPDPTNVAPGSSVSYAAAPTLSGVAAAGAPLSQATISVVDGKGVAVGTATTHAVDGSYSLTLNTKSMTVPLMVQARGMDASGTPQILHSAVPAMSAASAAMVDNVTPLSNAIVALSLGADPAPVFAAATNNASALTQLGNAASNAATFLKTLVKTQLTDLKFTSAASLDLMGDGTFTANKSAQDLLVESVRVSLGKNATGAAQLRMGNKLLATLAPEVLVDLPTAQTELLKTGGAPATAITSTLKATTSPTATLANLGSLDDLGAALNSLIAKAPDLVAMANTSLLSVYDVNDGRTRSDAAIKLESYVARNWQFGRFQTLGCADATVSGGLCNRVMVAAPVSDASGTVVDIFADAVSFNKASTTGSKWNLIGNGRDLGIAAWPLAFTALNADGSTSTSISPNPGTGIQIEIQAQSNDVPPVQKLASATVQMPNGFSIPFAYCTQALMCISSTTGATLLTPTGGIGDTALQQASDGRIGSADSVSGAKYVATYTPIGSTTAETRNVYLRADVLSNIPAARFPTLDGLSANAPLRSGELLVGRTLNWATWAAANPDMRLISIRTVLNDGVVAPLVTDTAPPLPPLTTLALPGLTLAASFVPISYEVWLGAQDSAGRRYYTRYSLTP